jgi:peptidoglycan hydrolase-like protein with peptidoglycan-binding domain
MLNCANPFAWALQTNIHEQVLIQNWPLLGEMVAASADENEFRARVSELWPEEKVQYDREFQSWKSIYGKAWDLIGCIPESYVAEHTAGVGWSGESDTPEPVGTGPGGDTGTREIQQALQNAGYPPGPIDGLWGPKTCGAMYEFNIAERKSYNKNFDNYFFIDLGFSTAKAATYSQRYGNKCDEYYAQYAHESESDVQAIQQQLQALGLYNGPIDGKWGIGTCAAIQNFQKANNLFVGGQLPADTFIALGFDQITAGVYTSLYGDRCVGDVTNGARPVAGNGDEVVPIEPIKAGFPWWVTAVLGFGLLGAMFVVGDKKKKKGKKS